MHDAIQLLRMLIKLAFGLLSLAVMILTGIFQLLHALFARGPEAFEGRVRVIDGDSLATVIEGEEIKIRIHGIDAPEFDQPEGAEATRTLRGLIEGHEATIKPVETDRYGRLVARIIREDGIDIGATMVRAGQALADIRYSTAYVRHQRAAAAEGAGFWRHGGICNPANWRAQRAAT